MQTFIENMRRLEFEARIFVSFGIIILISVLSFSVFAQTPANLTILGEFLGLSDEMSLRIGYVIVACIMARVSVLRMWAGSVLTSQRVMAFRVQVDSLVTKGPYLLVRNPIYLADLIAMCGFALCLPFVGILMPILFYAHYVQLVTYEQTSLARQFGGQYRDYMNRVPPLIPNCQSIQTLFKAVKDFQINRDGFRHNAPYLLFIPGFILSAFTHELLHAVVIGLPAVVDWALIHTKIGVVKKSWGGRSAMSGGDNITPSRVKVFEDILYAQCWEDPQIDRAALNITPDDVVFSITSGGCNVLTFLIDNPRQVIALDINPHQNFLLDLKIAAFKNLSYEALLEFIGVRESGRRLKLYERLRSLLEKESLAYWDRQSQKIEGGLIHCGRYEGYMRLLRRVITPLMGRPLIETFFQTEEPAARAALFHAKWENIWWRLFTRGLLSRAVMSLLFDKAFFAYLDETFSFGRHFAKKVERAFIQLPMTENYFLSYILLGKFYSAEHLPPYLRQENHEVIRSRVDCIERVTDSCEHFFSTLPDGSISKFNFTNIFEWMSPEAYENLLKETIRVAQDKAIMTYRNLLVFREHPASLESRIHSLKQMAESLHQRDLSFIYNNYVVEEIRKEGQKCHTAS